MIYSITELAKLTGVSTRTLRYYDQIKLLPARRRFENNYREYDEKAVDQLQMILFLQLFHLPLADIQQILVSSPANQHAALQNQLQRLEQEKVRIDHLIHTLQQTLAPEKGATLMTDEAKFAAFKLNQVAANQQQFGSELQEKYGQKAVAESDQTYLNLSPAQFQAMQATETELIQQLKIVTTSQDLESENAAQVYQLHKKWLQFNWQHYTAEMHRNLAKMYTADQRFADYYNQKVGADNAATTLVAIIEKYAH